MDINPLKINLATYFPTNMGKKLSRIDDNEPIGINVFELFFHIPHVVVASLKSSGPSI